MRIRTNTQSTTTTRVTMGEDTLKEMLLSGLKSAFMRDEPGTVALGTMPMTRPDELTMEVTLAPFSHKPAVTISWTTTDTKS